MQAQRRGRPAKFAEYDQLVASLPAVMEKRPKYLNGIGVFRGSRGLTAWLKIRLPRGGVLKGKNYAPNASVEIKVGSLGSWTWDQLAERHRQLQGKADRGEPLEDAPDLTFANFAEQWLERAEKRARAIQTERIATQKHLIPELGRIGLRQLSTADINRWNSEAPGSRQAGHRPTRVQHAAGDPERCRALGVDRKIANTECRSDPWRGCSSTVPDQ